MVFVFPEQANFFNRTSQFEYYNSCLENRHAFTILEELACFAEVSTALRQDTVPSVSKCICRL